MASKNYCLEHTKPLFTEQKIMNLENLHMYHIFMELFKILKFENRDLSWQMSKIAICRGELEKNRDFKRTAISFDLAVHRTFMSSISCCPI